MPKVLIDIPKDMYRAIKDDMYCGVLHLTLYDAIKNGTELPEDFSLEDYERYKKDSENLSWIKCPERMGN